jgi:hypothetical protein
VRRALATSLAVAIAVVAPAAASAQVQVTFRTWKVTTKNGKQHDVEPGGRFVRCGRKVAKLTATFDYGGATPGKSYKQIWSLDGSDIGTNTGQWADNSSTVHVYLFRDSGKPLDDGKYRLRLRQSGRGIGASYIRIKRGTGC